MDTKEQAMERAQGFANRDGKAAEVWEHVGDYGRPEGDIVARHVFKVVRFGSSEPGGDWAMIGVAEPVTSVTLIDMTERIANLMSTNEWNADLCDKIAELCRLGGYEVEDYNG